MGTTIRREPIRTSIPASPDYKFLNITNFGGIQKSSNPFVVSSNTASDCLNVYVDEDNALSTRPRVSPKYDLLKLANVGATFETIGVYNLHDGYLLHGVENGTYKMFKFVESETGLQTPIIISGTIPEKECKIFEQNEIIYILDGRSYKNIISAEISDVVGYVPTTRVGKNRRLKTEQADGTIIETYDLEGGSFESLNILSDKYKESYFWDGTWDPYKIKDKETEVVENNYLDHVHKPFSTGLSNDDTGCVILGYCKKASEDSSLYDYYYGYNYHATYNPTLGGTPFGVFEFDKETNTMVKFSPIPVETSYAHDDFMFEVSSNGLVAVLTNINDVGIEGNPYVLKFYKRNSVNDTFVNAESGFSRGNPVKQLVMTDFRAYWLSYDNRLESGINGMGVFTIDDNVKTFTVNTTGELCVYAKYDSLTDEITQIVWRDFGNVHDNTSHQLPNFLTTNEHLIDVKLQLAPDSKQLILSADVGVNSTIKSSKSWLYYLKDVVNDTEFTPLNKEGNWSSVDKKPFRFSETNDKVYFKTDMFTGWIYPENPESIVKHFYELNDALSDREIVTKNDSLSVASFFGFALNEYTFLFNSSEPLLFVTRTLDKYSKEQDDLEDLREKLLSAKLTQRFDNNTWLASGNTTFHTLYNDPTYIPLSSYNDLGEDYEDITGLSIVNDNILAAYKRNRIYIITPITVGDQLTYSYTETKNVIGNDAKGAPILTILTEMPVIVSYDGIYALNQLENVQSSDRITTLISESINPNWLKESKSDVDGCLTMNRLYWTYFILPHERIDGEKVDYTKVYLLDNRTQQWFYWELPVLCINAFVKDNKTHLVSPSGKIYTLETSDLIDNRSSNGHAHSETIYCDVVDKKQKLIPYHWRSQILSLNTINYSKRLIDTTFILTDTDEQDQYGLNYKFKAWRKSVSETNESTINDNVHYVQSTTKRTMIPRFNFIQIELSNPTIEDELNHNKLKLVGLGLKYVLLEGLY